MPAALRAAAPDVFADFQQQLRRDMEQPGYEPGAYDQYVANLS